MKDFDHTFTNELGDETSFHFVRGVHRERIDDPYTMCLLEITKSQTTTQLYLTESEVDELFDQFYLHSS